MEFKEFVKPELAVLIPVLYALGAWIKGSNCKDKLIPFILMGAGIFLTTIWVFATSIMQTTQDIFTAIFTILVQGVLVAAAAVFFNQLYKQGKKVE
jgi:hypothetical protein